MAKRDIGAEIVAGLKQFRDNQESLRRYEIDSANTDRQRPKATTNGTMGQRFEEEKGSVTLK